MSVLTVKLPEKTIQVSLHDFELGTSSKIKIDNLDFLKIQNFCVINSIIKKVKRQPIEWEKILVNHMFDRGLESRIYKEL